MGQSAPNSVVRLLDTYRGIEGFYVINKTGQLGYIQSREPYTVRETFSGLKEKGILQTRPDVSQALELFQYQLREIASDYLDTLSRDQELGYVLPAGSDHPWHTATLVFHEHILESLRDDYDVMIKDSMIELTEAERILARLTDVRSIYQGLDELAYHEDAWGQYKYFPALFFLPNDLDSEKTAGLESKVRVINLYGRDSEEENQPPPPPDKGHPRDLIYSVLRDNLTERGVIDRSQRIENRFSVT